MPFEFFHISANKDHIEHEVHEGSKFLDDSKKKDQMSISL